MIFKVHPSNNIVQYKTIAPDLKIISNELSLDQLLSQTYLTICDTNQTTFLECLAKNIPTIIFWDTNYQELSDLAKSYFKKLSEQGIFFESGLAAAKQVNMISNNVLEWWSEPKRIKTVLEFVNTFARPNKNWYQDYKEIDKF